MGNAVKGSGQSRTLIALLLAVLWHTPAVGQGPPGLTTQNPPLDTNWGSHRLPRQWVPPVLLHRRDSARHRARLTIAPDSIPSPVPVGLDFSIPPSRSAWYGSLDAMALRRVVQPKDDFVVATLGESGPTALSTGDLDFDFTYGGRVMVGHMLSPCFSLEAVYFTTGSWTDTQSVNDQSPNAIGGLGNLFSPFSNFGNPPINGLDYNSFVSIHNQSNLQNFELNLRWDVPVFQSLAVSLLAGRGTCKSRSVLTTLLSPRLWTPPWRSGRKTTRWAGRSGRCSNWP